MAGNTSWVRCSGATTCISNMSFTRRSGNSSNGRKNVTAASFTKMSGRPPGDDLGEQALPVLGLGEIGLDGDGRTTGGCDLLAGLAERAHVRASGSMVRAAIATVAPSAASR